MFRSTGLKPMSLAPDLGHPLLSHANVGDRVEISEVEEVRGDTEAQGARSEGQSHYWGIWGINVGDR